MYMQQQQMSCLQSVNYSTSKGVFIFFSDVKSLRLWKRFIVFLCTFCENDTFVVRDCMSLYTFCENDTFLVHDTII